MKSVNILVAIRWVAQAWSIVSTQTISKCFRKAGILNSEMDIVSSQAWSIVSTQTISKCFRKAGILNSEMDIVSCSMEEDDPFSAVDVEADPTSLIHDVVPNCCSSDEYINGEDSIPVCNDLDSLTWEEDFMHQLGQVGSEEEGDEDEKDDSEQLPISNVKTYKDAMKQKTLHDFFPTTKPQ